MQGILDVGMTKEDKVELVKTHSFTRKHATGKAKIELHVLQVERVRPSCEHLLLELLYLMCLVPLNPHLHVYHLNESFSSLAPS